MSIKLITKYADRFVAPHELEACRDQLTAAYNTLKGRSGPGNDFLGWVDLPVDYDKEEFARIKAAAGRIREMCDVFIVIGIGGSYLGARAAIELLKSQNYNVLKKDTPDIYFVGNSISPTYLSEILSVCEGKDICVNVISKSGTTTEPALALLQKAEAFAERLRICRFYKVAIVRARQQIFNRNAEKVGNLN